MRKSLRFLSSRVVPMRAARASALAAAVFATVSALAASPPDSPAP